MKRSGGMERDERAKMRWGKVMQRFQDECEVVEKAVV